MENFYTQIKNTVSKSIDNIFIIGKGSSIDSFDLTKITDNSFVINLNDSERIIPGDIAIFNSEWVIEHLKETNFKAKLYLSPFDLSNHNITYFQVPLATNNQDSQDLFLKRLKSKDLQIENYLFSTALKIADIIASNNNVTMNVFLLGFDFDYSKGFSKTLNKRYPSSEYSSFIIKSQKLYFQELISKKVFDNINIFHIGNQSFSKQFPITTEQKVNKSSSSNNFEYSSELKAIYEDLIKSEKVILTAELTTNHFGNLEDLKEMVVLSKEAGADMVKVQKRNIETFYTKEELESKYISPFGRTFRDYREQLELDGEGFLFLDNICRELNIPWYSSVLDIDSFKFLEKFKCPIIKVPSTISNKVDFLEYLSMHYKGDIVISTGMTDDQYEAYLLKNFSKCNRLYLLQCNSAYPTPPEECNIAVISRYRELSKKQKNLIPGYSSHDIGSLASCMAISAGAKMIEKHVKLRPNDWAHFDSVALELIGENFKNFANDIRIAEKIFGSSIKKINANEHHKY